MPPKTRLKWNIEAVAFTLGTSALFLAFAYWFAVIIAP